MNEESRFKQTADLGRVPNDWDIKIFLDVMLEKPRNGLYKPKEFHGKGTKIVNMGELFAYDKIGDSNMELIELTDSEKKRFLLKNGDLVFARRSLIASGAGKCSLVVGNVERTFESSIIRVRPDSGKANSEYLYYFFSSSVGKHLLDSILRQVAVSGITGSDLMNLKIPLPSVQEQHSVAEFLAVLDAKITVNRQMNRTLEDIGQAIFKRWFVDFEFPNEEGKPYKSSGGQMVHSEEIGKEIPRDWKVSTLGEMTFNFDSKRVPLSSREREKMQGNYPYYGAAGILDYVDNFIFNGTYALMGEDGTVIDENGFPVLQLVRGKFWVNNHAHILQGKGVSTELLFLLLKNTNVQHIVTGAVQPKINQGNMNTLKFVIPYETCKNRLEKFVNQLYTKIGENEKQSQTLAQIRDLLLPKLMSGKIRIPLEKQEA
jgi:type I restriction enzyme S subunit